MGGRARARVIIVALAGAVVAAGAAFGLEAVALPRPPRGFVVAANAIGELDRYRFARSVADLDGRRAVATCFQGWFRVPGQRHGHIGAATVLRGGGAVIAVGARVWTFGPHALRRRVATTALRLTCPHVLGNVLARALIRGRVVVTSRRGDGRSVYEIAFRLRRERIGFLVDRSTLQPLAIAIHGRGAYGMSDVEVGADRLQIRRMIRTLRMERRRHAFPA